MTKKHKKRRLKKVKTKLEKETEERIVFLVTNFSLLALRLGEGAGPLDPPGYAYVVKWVACKLLSFMISFAALNGLQTPNLEPETECFLRQNLE